MADELVRARVGRVEKNVGRKFAQTHGLEVLDEPTTRPDGSLRGQTLRGGRRDKKRTSVAEQVAEKKQAVTEPADEKKEQDQ
jgi:hypothetical protein